MSCCYIFNKSLLIDADLSNATIDISKLKNLIPAYSTDTSGIWQPIIIKKANNTLNKVDFLRQAEDLFTDFPFNPLSCSAPPSISYESLLDSNSFGCNYCKTPTNFNTTWKLRDSEGNIRKIYNNNGDLVEAEIQADCCSGACDTRMRLDDFVPKIPVLNQNYLNKFYDFKYLNQFPATTNAGIGFDEFIKINGTKMSSFSSSPDLIIDWRIKDTTSEISYDPLNSYYNSAQQHHKSFKKSKIVSQTCGNFILTNINQEYKASLPNYISFSGLIGDPDQSKVSSDIEEILPSVPDFTAPYGFEKSTYNNIFIKNKKIASYWKWNYESGVLCWYRYFDKDKKDDRPINGVDLYISPGDVFYTTNEGPEPPPISYDSSMKIKPCPSGLKVMSSGTVSCVIPSGSSFTYISQNLYPKFLEIYGRLTLAAKLDDSNISIKDRFELASLLCTAPEYDGVTVDLLLRNKNYNYNINKYFQINTLNKRMLQGTSYGSVGKLNYIKNNVDLINTLADKYGSYLWCPPNSTKNITLKEPVKSQCLIDIDFDMVTIDKNVRSSSTTCQTTLDCSYNISNKIFAYSQKISVGQSSLELKLDTKTRYKNSCNNATNTSIGSSRIASLYLNNSLLKEVAYNTGCYVLQDTYPRIVTSDTSNDTCCNSSGINCNVCDKDSSYYLAGGESLCKGYQGDLSWCDATFARFYNNSEPGNTIGNRPARNIVNNTLYFKRSYPSVAFNPHIDNVAFHHQGGVHYSNTMFGSLSGTTVFAEGVTSLFDSSNQGTLSIEFTTKDVGIKIYSLSVEKLRGADSSSYGCRAFPIKEKCKCYGLTNITEYPYICNNSGPITLTNNPTLYTPNLSTTFSPKLKAYGGYSEDNINEMLGGGDISNKIKILKKEIENLNKTVNFLELAGLSYDKDGNSLQGFKDQISEKNEQVKSLKQELSQYRIPNHPDPENDLPDLNKYINPLKPYGDEQSVTITLNNYVTSEYSVQLPAYDTTHADIWARVSENIDFALKRYATKVTFNNDVIVYDQQKKSIANKSSSSTISVKLSNPYLEALLDGENVLYPPNGSLCVKGGNFSSKGDEISSVDITFTRVPRKQLLSFYIKAAEPMGILKKGFFHPNSGLIDRKTSDPSLTPIFKDINNNIFISYDKDLFDPDGSFSDKGIVYYSELNSSVRRTIQQIGQFNNHRKPRLYLQLNNLWYEYKMPNTFGFYNQELLNIGEPFIFEYLDNEKNYSAVGPWLPVAAKKHVDFDFIYNYTNHNIPVCYQQPIVSKNQQKPKEIILDGTRSYFYIKEIDSAIVSLSSTIDSLTEEDQNSISTDSPELVLSNGERYRYISGPKNQRSSYIISDYNYLYHNFSDLHINYNIKNKSNYIYNTKKRCNQKVIVINAENTKKTYETQIVEKKLYAIYTDEYGNKLKINDKASKKYLKIYTQLVLDNPLKYDKAYIDFTCLFDNFSNTEGIDSFILLKNLKNLLKKENDNILSNPLIETKWGDLLNYDSMSTNELTKYFINNNYINKVYPSSLYGNNFYKTIVNNGNYFKHNFAIRTDNETIRLDLSDAVYFNIHQKYNIDYNNSLYSTQSNFWTQNNYLPYMDINILPDDNISSSRSKLTNKLNSIVSDNGIFFGSINISGIYQNISNNHNWQNYFSPSEGKYFWINLDISKNLESSLSLISSANGFYSNSMRIDDPPFQLNKIQYSTQVNNIEQAKSRKIYNPTNNLNSTVFENKVFNFEHFDIKNTGSVFDISSIYGDRDVVSGCSNADCNITTVGTGTYSGDYSFYFNKTQNISYKNNNIPYIISYDAGIYNPMGSRNISYITRHELPANNHLFPLSECDASYNPRPANYNNSILNEEYQSILLNSIVDDHTLIVKNTDTIANEMLFRLLYGEQQKLNYERIDGTNNRVKLEDLYKYIYPKTEAKDLYKNIQYDMDITSDCSNRKINGSISINGVLQIGNSTSVSINDKTISFIIENNNNNGTVDIVASCDSKTARSIIYRTKNISDQVIVSTSTISPSSPNEKYTLLKKCKERRQINLSLINKITKAEIDTPGCERDAQNNPITVRARFPYWKTDDFPDGKACTAGPYFSSNNGGECAFINGKWVGDPHIYFGASFACAWTESISQSSCDNRGVGPVIIPNSCYEITTTEASDMVIKDYSRGVARTSCHIGGTLTSPSYDAFTNNLGPIENFVTTMMLDDTVGVSLNPRYQTSNCGVCFSLDSKDWSNNDRYNKLGRDFPVGLVSTSDACECVNYEYGYCRNSDDAAKCSCSSLNYEYNDFDYTFQYCKHSISLKGYKRKLVGKLKDPDLITDNQPYVTLSDGNQYDLCTITAGKANAYKYPNNSDPNLVITEQCTWYYCDKVQPDTYHIYNRQTTTDNSPYKPSCSQLLCNITYDNNKIMVNLGGSSNNSLCIPIEIRNNCPSLSVTIPNDSYSVVDNIESECSDSKVDDNRALIVDQHPAWDIITETRTCVVGYLLQNNPNEDGPVGYMGGCQTIGCDVCTLCPRNDACNGYTHTTCGYGLCGKNAPDSYPWHICISKMNNGYVCVNGNYHDRSGNATNGYSGYPSVMGCDIPVEYPLETSNVEINEIYMREWESNMQQIYKNIASCHTNGPKIEEVFDESQTRFNKDRIYNENDIVEGVVPKSCSDLLFTTLRYPGIKFRTTFNNPVVQSHTIEVKVAYYTYQYRRPRTIQDILREKDIGEDKAKQCNELASLCSNNTLRLSSNYMTKDCNQSPTCYDTNMQKCTSNNYCCKQGKIEYD